MYQPVPQTISKGPSAAEKAKKRATEHTRNAYERLMGGGPGVWWHWFYFCTKVATALTTITFFVVLLCIMGAVVFADSWEHQVFVTNTYLATNDNENNVSWQVMTYPAWNGLPRNTLTFYTDQKSDHLYECLWISQQGWSMCNQSAATVSTYQQCLNANYGTVLTSCNPSVNTYNWPTANTYANCINNGMSSGTRQNLNALKSCIKSDLWPLYEVPLDVDTGYFLGAFSWPLMMVTGAWILLAFGFYTIYPVDFEDTTLIELGKTRSGFSRLGFVWLGLPAAMMAVWMGITLAIAFRPSTWPNANVNYYPSTHQTNVVVVTASMVAFFYFVLEACEFIDRKFNGYEQASEKMPEPAAQVVHLEPARDDHAEWETHGGAYDEREGWQKKMGRNRLPGPMRMQRAVKGGLGYLFPIVPHMWAIDSIQSAAEAYVPVLTQTWSDAYLADPLFMLGAVGATLQLTTADAYNIFWCLMYHRIAHAGVARLVYHSYVKSPVADAETNAARPTGLVGHEGGAAYEALAATRVFALNLHISGVFALLVFVYIMCDTSRVFPEYGILYGLWVAGLMVPECIRFCGHVYLALTRSDEAHKKGTYILIFTQFLWLWDLVVRMIVMILIFWGDSGQKGSKPFLTNRLYTLNQMLTFTSSCCPSNPGYVGGVNGTGGVLACC